MCTEWSEKIKVECIDRLTGVSAWGVETTIYQKSEQTVMKQFGN